MVFNQTLSEIDCILLLSIKFYYASIKNIIFCIDYVCLLKASLKLKDHKKSGLRSTDLKPLFADSILSMVQRCPCSHNDYFKVLIIASKYSLVELNVEPDTTSATLSSSPKLLTSSSIASTSSTVLPATASEIPLRDSE